MAKSIFKEAISIDSPDKNKFDLSHEKKLSCGMGTLIPVLVQEVLPGDSFKVDTHLMVRLAPMLAPLMHRIDCYTHSFFVPNRIIWNEWEPFLTGGADGMQAPVHPQINLKDINNPTWVGLGTLLDYMGFPPLDINNYPTEDIFINELPFRAYTEIYNEYYRDENLIAPIAYSKGSGISSLANPQNLTLLTQRQRAWEKDYFTTALPWAQKGAPAGAPVEYTPGLATPAKLSLTGAPAPANPDLPINAAGNLETPAGGIRLETEATVLISEIRKANALQRLLEATARGGHRLTEYVLHVFGVKSADSRIQRPEYIGGGRTPVMISEVLSNFQFSGDVEGKPQGNMAGHGIASGSDHGFSYQSDEHGWFITIMSIVPKANYYQGIEKMWRRANRFDYFLPQFAHIGEQEVLNSEVYYDPTAGIDDGTFGYQSRFAEYKFKLSTIHGEFRDTLDYWHMARKFTTQPALNQSFVECVPTTDIFAVPSEPSFFVQLWHDISAIRPLPYFSNPKL